jgi:ubiquitin-conjugating enzyme E2 variant
MIVAGVITAWLAADLVTGAVHWWEDRYGDPAWPLVGAWVVAPNIRHHHEPRSFLAGGYWQRNSTTILPAAAVAAIAAALGQWWVCLVAVFASQANEIHGWAHQRCSRPIRGLQLLGLLHSQEQHAVHHERPFDRAYCVMTDFTNPVLSAVGFWPAIEWLIACVGPRPRPERMEA